MKNNQLLYSHITTELADNEARTGWILLCLHIIFMYTRPQEIFTFLQPLRLPGIIALLLTFWVIKNFDKNLLKMPSISFVVKFGGLCLVSFLWSVHTISITIGITWLLQYLPVAIAVTLLVRNLKKYKVFISLWCISHFFVFLIIFKNGGKGSGDFLADENDAALGVAMVLPIILYFSYWPNITPKHKFLLKTLFLIACVAIIATRSRGGLLGLVSAAGMLWLFSKSKLKILFTGSLLVLLAGSILLSYLPEGYLEDVQGISDPNDSTRSERIETWEISWIMFKDNPIWGVGAGNFPWNVNSYQDQASWWYPDARSLHGRQTHSLYFQLLADLALVGMLIYITFIITTASRLFKTQRSIFKSQNPDPNLIGLGLMCKALYISIFPFLVSGAFISVGYYPHIVMWGTLSYATLATIETITKKCN
ncbi:O-antigen ligase family protein [Saccharophagus degradans]|nr:O-antigen ligase family protein [Saccharophagus degradans]